MTFPGIKSGKINLKPEINTIKSAGNTGSGKSTSDLSMQSQPLKNFKGDRVIQSDTVVLTLEINDLIKLCAASSDFSSYRVLKQLQNRFQDVVPRGFSSEIIPRSGFIFVGQQQQVELSVEQWAKTLIQFVEIPLAINGHSINLTANIGIARADAYCTTLADLSDQAQYALMNSSDIAGSDHNIFDSSLAEESHDEVTLTQELYRAMDNDEFTLYYQPVMSLENTQIVGAEALVRWNHPNRGFISPGKFIPLAEKTGQILFLDRWVLEESVNQIMDWKDTLDREVPLGVNISAWQFRDDFLVDKVETVMKDVGLPPHLLKIEITETSLMNDTQHAADMIQELKELGIKIALDDFGTGHASFKYLSEFDIDQLKIDRSFLNFDDIYAKNQTLVDVIIETGRRVGIDILAEGVETEEQENFVTNRGCQKAQGWLFHRAMPAEEFGDLLKQDDTICAPKNQEQS